MNVNQLVIFLCLVVAGIAAGTHFGWLAGLGTSAGLFVLMPWHPRA